MKRLSEVPEHMLTLTDSTFDTEVSLHVSISERDIAGNAINNVVWLSRKAAQTANYAWSWRNFNVGAAGLAIDTERGALAIMSGFNVKPMDGDDGPNIHAEQMVLAKLRRGGYRHLAAIAVWGELLGVDGDSTRQPKTLHPCNLCRDHLLAAPEVTDDTIVLNGTRDFSTVELCTFGELLDYYKPGSASEFTTLDLSDAAIDQPDADERIAIQLFRFMAERGLAGV